MCGPLRLAAGKAEAAVHEWSPVSSRILEPLAYAKKLRALGHLAPS